MSIFGFFCGLIALVGGVVCPFVLPIGWGEVIFVILALMGIIDCAVGMKRRHRGLGIAGLVLSIIAIIISIVFTFACSIGQFASDRLANAFYEDFFSMDQEEIESYLDDLSGEIESALSNQQEEQTEGLVQRSADTPSASDPAIVGSWEYQGGNYVYEFNSDLTGTYSGMNFTYEAKNGVLSILYEGSAAPMELNYEINGTVLNVKDSQGRDTLYNRK